MEIGVDISVRNHGGEVLRVSSSTKADRIEIRPFLSLGQAHQNLLRDYVFKQP
jgi:hypothetical protein